MSARRPNKAPLTEPSREALITAGLLECAGKGEEEIEGFIWQTYLRAGDMFYVIGRSKLGEGLYSPAVDEYTFQAMDLSNLAVQYPVYRYEAYSEELRVNPGSDNAPVWEDEHWNSFKSLVDDARNGIPTNIMGEPIHETS